LDPLIGSQLLVYRAPACFEMFSAC